MTWIYNQQTDTWIQKGRTAITGTSGLPAPVANFTLATTGLSVAFNATSSTQTGGTIIAYAWDFGDGTTGTGATPTHVYAAAGTFTVGLTVTGSSTLGATTTKPVSVTVPVNAAPNASFTYTQGTGTDSYRLNVDATASNDNDGTIVKYRWDFGNGQTYETANKTANGFLYTAGGTYTVTLTVTDDDGATGQTTKIITVIGQNSVPTVSITGNTLSTDKKSVTLTWAAADSDGYISAVDINWGDSTTVTHLTGTGSVPPVTTATHTYAVSGPLTATVTVTDNTGATANVSATVNPVMAVVGTTENLTPYNIGTPSDNIPSTVRIYTFADLGLTAATTNVQTVVDKLPGVGVIQLPNGYQGVIPNFNHHGTDSTGAAGTRPVGYGIQNANFAGFLGGLTDGKPNAKISMAANAMSANQLAAFPRRKVGDAPTGTVAIHAGAANTFYFGGVEFDGANQQTVTDGAGGIVGPAGWSGMALNGMGPNSIIQNCYFRGFSKATMTAPPGENGMWSETHSVNATFRRTELDGRLPGSTTRVAGGLMWNAASGYLVEDVYLHDAAWSGYTSSFTSTPSSTASMSHDYTTRRLHSVHNSNHGVAGDNFSAINMEFNFGTIHHYQPHLSRDAYGGDAGHIRQWVYSSGLGTAPATTKNIVHQPKWDESYSGANGLFTITMVGFVAGGNNFTLPTVYLTADETKPATPYTGASVPSNITTAGNYYWLRKA